MGFFKVLKIKIIPPNADSGLPEYEAIAGPDFTDEEPADTPRSIIEKSKWVYLSTPKKAGERLVQHPINPPEGWGLKFEEGLIIPRLMQITFWLLFLCCLATRSGWGRLPRLLRVHYLYLRHCYHYRDRRVSSYAGELLSQVSVLSEGGRLGSGSRPFSMGWTITCAFMETAVLELYQRRKRTNA
jgi:hypothetical protein